MTWTISLGGYDDLPEEAKKEFEETLVENMRNFVLGLKSEEGVNVTVANVTTNTTGSVNVLNEETN